MGTSAQDFSVDRRLGDGNSNAFNLTQSLAANVDGLDFFAVIGDVSYAEGFAGEWEGYIEMMRPVAERIPFLTVSGNHEADDSLGECNMAYEKRYGMFMPKFPKAPEIQWYSFDQGMVHVVAMSTEHNYTVGSPQYQFLKNDLEVGNSFFCLNPKRILNFYRAWIVKRLHG